MLIPSRGRPESVDRQAEAWEQTDPLKEARLIWILDLDDPMAIQYQDALARHPWMEVACVQYWTPMVRKLNEVAVTVQADVVGFMGDDHLPRTPGWAVALAAASRTHGPGIFYGRDGLKDIKLPTWWAMSEPIIRTLGRMVPADVEHLYCDNAVLELGKAARCIRYLPSVFIEHMHPVANKSEWDSGYVRVNGPDQYERDRSAYIRWLRSSRKQQAEQIAALRG